ncbi:unnamed protein product [Caretta caretta]
MAANFSPEMDNAKPRFITLHFHREADDWPGPPELLDNRTPQETDGWPGSPTGPTLAELLLATKAPIVHLTSLDQQESSSVGIALQHISICHIVLEQYRMVHINRSHPEPGRAI